jgi:hypothetical protein
MEKGYQLQFTKKPTPLTWTPKKISIVDQMEVNKAVEKFLAAGIIEKSPTQSTAFLSTFFTIQEITKRGSILDCKKLNQYLQIEHFKMEGVLALREILGKGDYMCKIDLKDAYVVVPFIQILKITLPSRTMIPFTATGRSLLGSALPQECSQRSCDMR